MQRLLEETEGKKEGVKMGWNGEGLTDIQCPKCGARMDLISGAWSECPPDAFKLSCPKCDYFEDMDYDEGYDLMMKMVDDFYRKAEEKRNRYGTK